MKKILTAVALIVSGLLSGCNQLTQYTVSEQEISQAPQRRNHFTKDIGLKGVVNAHTELQNLTSAIGREEPGKVTLTGVVSVDLNSLFDTQKATIDLKSKTLPTFDREKGAIFLQEMEVAGAKVVPGKLQSVIQALLPYPDQLLCSYFSQQPVHILREDASIGETLARKYAEGIEVKPGETVIFFTSQSPGRYGALNFLWKWVQRKTFMLILSARQKTTLMTESISRNPP